MFEQIRAGAPRTPAVERALEKFRVFTHSQVIGSIVLLIFALIAIVWANSPFSESYFHLWETPLAIRFGESEFSMTLHQWLNEALMMAFFLIVGLEVKEQILVGELSSLRQALLPVAAALGGMIVPALIYLALNGGTAGARGWGIPMSTDIAFALGILALLGRRIPFSLKIFLAALAIADDIGAILVITFFYTGEIAFTGVLIAAVFWVAILVLGRLSIYNAYMYFTLSLGVWWGFFIAGIHPTIAGVLVAFAIPSHSLLNPNILRRLFDKLELQHFEGHEALRDHERKEQIVALQETVQEITPPLTQLEHSLQPWVTFVVMPVFALANAGVVIGGEAAADVFSPVTLGIIAGLVLGKPLGITLFAWGAVRLGLATLPQQLRWGHIIGASMLAGVGFTMSLFVTELAFVSGTLAESAKIGILLASFVAGCAGFAFLRSVTPAKGKQPVLDFEEQAVF